MSHAGIDDAPAAASAGPHDVHAAEHDAWVELLLDSQPDSRTIPVRSLVALLLMPARELLAWPALIVSAIIAPPERRARTAAEPPARGRRR